MTQPTAMVTAFLAWSLLAFPTGYSKSDNTAEAEQAVRWGATYLLKLFQPTVGSTYDGGATIIYQVNLSVYMSLCCKCCWAFSISQGTFATIIHQVSLSVCSYTRICCWSANTVSLSAFLSVPSQPSYTR